MITNESTTDRTIRAIAGAGGLAGGLALGIGTPGGVLLAALGGILVVTGAVGFCPLYRLFGVSTARVRKQ